jgi:hypothetical protein
MEKGFESEFCTVIGEKGESQWSIREHREKTLFRFGDRKVKGEI